MKTARWILVVYVITLTLAVTGVLPVVQAQDGPNWQSAGLIRYEGEGFWFYYPANATIEQISETEIRVLGPDIAVRPADADFVVSGPAYQMDVIVHENPERVFPEVWAQEKILADWQAAVDAGDPAAVYPVTENGELDLEKFTTPIVANWPAAQAEFFGFDSAVMHVYIGGFSDKIVEFVYRQEFVPNNPLAILQQDVYALILGTFEAAVG